MREKSPEEIAEILTRAAIPEGECLGCGGQISTLEEMDSLLPRHYCSKECSRADRLNKTLDWLIQEIHDLGKDIYNIADKYMGT